MSVIFCDDATIAFGNEQVAVTWNCERIHSVETDYMGFRDFFNRVEGMVDEAEGETEQTGIDLELADIRHFYFKNSKQQMFFGTGIAIVDKERRFMPFWNAWLERHGIAALSGA